MAGPATPLRAPRALNDRLERALRQGELALDLLADAEPVDQRDRLLTLLTVHDLHTSPIDSLGDTVHWQHHPVVAGLKYRLEQDVLAELPSSPPAGDAVAQMRAIARRDLVPDVYGWLAEQSSWDELVEYLALEGGPDAGFDDLVAACQIGLSGQAKLELARNYWDEMGRGELEAVHTELHHQLSEALAMPRIERREQPTSGLLRSVLGSILATNRALQPEMVGALGLLELQAGPRCRKVVRALERLGAPADALPFYVEHAEVDPHHGKAWLDRAVRPLSRDPRWAEGIVRGALWRSEVNRAFFDDMAERFTGRLASHRAAPAERVPA